MIKGQLIKPGVHGINCVPISGAPRKLRFVVQSPEPRNQNLLCNVYCKNSGFSALETNNGLLRESDLLQCETYHLCGTSVISTILQGIKQPGALRREALHNPRRRAIDVLECIAQAWMRAGATLRAIENEK